MTLISTRDVELLKTRILATAEIKNIVPADCRLLENLVFAKTRQRVSETTLKRLYGFALSQFKPSFFTVDVLAKYCDHSGWIDFCDKNQQPSGSNCQTDVDWALLQNSANKITGFTIQALKNRSGIPYHHTIKRRFIDYHIEDFIESNQTGTVICAPAGYGKTLALCHWVEQKTQVAGADTANDIVLYFSSNALMNVLLCGKDINHWMLALLGYNPDQDLSVLLDVQKRKGKFYLIIDGLDEHMFRHDQFQVVLNQLVDIFSFYQSENWFKLIITMRASTWINHKHQIDIDGDSWHTGFNSADTLCINVPLLDISEIEELGNKINPNAPNLVSSSVAEVFKHPLYFQFYYKQHKADFSFNHIDHICLYDLISTFILNKVYLGTYSTEKILLIRELINHMDIAGQKYHIDKLKVNGLVKKYHHAYSELLSIGFLREVNQSNDYQYSTTIQFVSDGFLEHSIAKNLLYQNGDVFDHALVHKINTLLSHHDCKPSVIKWCVLHAIKTGQQDSFEMLTEFVLTGNEKSDLILFLGDLLDKQSTPIKGNELMANYFYQDFSDKLFNYFFGLELVDSNHYKALSTLLKFKLSNKKRILVYTHLAIAAIIKLDMVELEDILTQLKKMPTDEHQLFIINPMHCLDTIYHYLKYGVIKKEALRELTALMFQSGSVKGVKVTQSNDMLWLLGLYTTMLCGNPQKALRFANFMKAVYKNNELADSTTPYSFFIKVVIADSLYALGKHAMVAAIYYTIAEDHRTSERLLTPYMRMLFHCLKIKVLINTNNAAEILSELKCVNAITDESGYKLSKLYIYSVLLRSSNPILQQPEFKKEVNYHLAKIIRDCNLNRDVFFAINPVINQAAVLINKNGRA